MSPDEVFEEVEKDRIFYEESCGGMTISGGEPTAQYEFTTALLRLATNAGIHTCIETSGFAPGTRLANMMPLVDLFLWDLKDTDPERHRVNTGVPLYPILSNLSAVDLSGGSVLLRCIMVAGVNMLPLHLTSIADICHGLRHCVGVELMPYHPLGNSKYEKLGLGSRLPLGWVPADDEIKEARDTLRRLGVRVFAEG
jgi:pyruvate formate lyase activating enzyme